MVDETRLDRQLMIEDWDQGALENQLVTIIGNTILVDDFVTSAAALGIKRLRIISPNQGQKNRFSLAKKVNKDLELTYLDSFFINKNQEDFLNTSETIIDLSSYNVSKKIVLGWLYRNKKKGIIVKPKERAIESYTYSKGKENKRLEQVLDTYFFPRDKQIDKVASIIATGVILEEVKNILMGKKTSDKIITYDTGQKKKFLELYDNNKVLVVGAGALGNFVGMLLARIGVNNINIIDPDTIEATNLNRQILFYDAVDKNKAKVLADRLNKINPNSSYGIVGKIDKSYKKIKKYDIVFDCVDNFETRIVLSNLCKSNGTILISGGTDYKSGQVVTYVPGFTKTPREILNLDKIVEQRPKKEIETTEAGCLYQPDPSVIMSNQIVAGLMVNEFRKITHPLFFDDITRGMIKYDSEADKRISKIIIK